MEADGNEDDVTIKLFDILVRQEEALKDSRNPNYSEREKNSRFAESEKLKAQFERLAKEAEGIPAKRNASKGAAYALAYQYLTEYPDGSITVIKGDIPSLLSYARKSIPEIQTQHGKLETDGVTSALSKLDVPGA